MSSEYAQYVGFPRYPDDGLALAHLATPEERTKLRLAMGNAGLYGLEVQFRADNVRRDQRSTSP